MSTPPTDHRLRALLEIQAARREDLITGTVIADDEDHVAGARCAEMVAQLSDSARRFARQAAAAAALVESDASPP